MQADLKTFYAHRVFGMAVLAALTVQNTRGVRRVVPVAPDLVREQIIAIFDDAPPHAIKTGALGGREQVEAVVDALSGVGDALPPLVVDPVCVSKSGDALIDDDGRRALLQRLLPMAALVTPNLYEAELLLGREVRTSQQMLAAGRALIAFGAKAALIKGGHREGEPIDVLCTADGSHELRAKRIVTRHTHGVGCTLSAAIAARLARGESLVTAASLAKRWLTSAIASAPGVGKGQGSVDHFAPVLDADHE